MMYTNMPQEDLLAELDALVEEETEAKLTDVPAALPAKPGKVLAPTEAEPALPDLPAVPTNKPVPPSSVAVCVSCCVIDWIVWWSGLCPHLLIFRMSTQITGGGRGRGRAESAARAGIEYGRLMTARGARPAVVD